MTNFTGYFFVEKNIIESISKLLVAMTLYAWGISLVFCPITSIRKKGNQF